MLAAGPGQAWAPAGEQALWEEGLATGPGQACAPAGEQALWEEGLAADGGPSSADREGDVVSSTA